MTKNLPFLKGSKMIQAGPQLKIDRNQRPKRVSLSILPSIDHSKLFKTRLVSRTHRPLWAKTGSKLEESLMLVWLIRSVVAQASVHSASNLSPNSQLSVRLKQSCSSNTKLASSLNLEVASHSEVLITRGSSRLPTCSSLSSSRPSLTKSSHCPWRLLCLTQASNQARNQARSSQRVQYLVRLISLPCRFVKWRHRSPSQHKTRLPSRWTNRWPNRRRVHGFRHQVQTPRF